MTQTNLDLKPEHREFCRLYVLENMSQVEAYALAHGINPGHGDEARDRISERARKLKTRPKIVAYMRKLRFEMKLKDIDDPRNAMRDLLTDMERARGEGNFTALAAMHRLRMAFHGLNKQDQRPQEPSQSLTDAELIEALADGDKAKAQIIRKLLGESIVPVESTGQTIN